SVGDDDVHAGGGERKRCRAAEAAAAAGDEGGRGVALSAHDPMVGLRRRAEKRPVEPGIGDPWLRIRRDHIMGAWTVHSWPTVCVAAARRCSRRTWVWGVRRG